MKEIKYGFVTIILPDELDLVEQAGRLRGIDVSRVVKAPPGLGQACIHTADTIESVGGQFTTPTDVTPADLRQAGQKAEKVDQILQDLEAATNYVRQSGLLYKATAYEKLRKVNDFVKAQGKHNPECYKRFGLLRNFFKKLGRKFIGPIASTEIPETGTVSD